MSFSIKNSYESQIPDFIITAIVFLIGCIFSTYILFSVKSVAKFIAGFENPLIFSLYYLWIKALVVDIRRISNEKEKSGYFPGFVYWVYATQWLIYGSINDLAFSSSQLSSTFNGNVSWIASLYFLNRSLFWLILDIASSILLVPLRYTLTKSTSIKTFLLLDYLKFLLIFIIYTLASIF